MENAWKVHVSKCIWRLRRKYLSVYGEFGILGLFAVHEIVSKTRKEVKHIRRICRKNLCVPHTWGRRKETQRILLICQET
jgi:hypothetical protein